MQRSGTVARSWGGLLLVLALAGGAATATTLRRDTFFPVPLGPGQLLIFQGCTDTLVLRAGDVAAFRWADGSLWLGNGRREVAVRPLVPCSSPGERDDVPPDPGVVPRLRSFLDDPPRIRQLLGGRTAVPDTTWYRAYRTWVAERESLASRIRRRFGAASAAQRAMVAASCRDLLAADPLVVPGSVTLTPPDDPAADGYVLKYTLRGYPVRSVIDFSAPLPGDAARRTIRRDAALALHHLVWRLFRSGRAYRIDLSRGLLVEIQNGEGE